MGAELDRAVIVIHLPQHFSRSLESATYIEPPLTNRRSRRHQFRILSRSPSRTTKKRRSGKK
ncbi:unnamed protein product [Musa banksii]